MRLSAIHPAIYIYIYIYTFVFMAYFPLLITSKFANHLLPRPPLYLFPPQLFSFSLKWRDRFKNIWRYEVFFTLIWKVRRLSRPFSILTRTKLSTISYIRKGFQSHLIIHFPHGANSLSPLSFSTLFHTHTHTTYTLIYLKETTPN